MNPKLWAACKQVNRHFVAPSGALLYAQYRKSDKVAFARQVLVKLEEHEELEAVT
ncbi:hypothetical protein [Spirosoma profusum]|nr:hypothetical protein [Spirosoma profusum]